MKNIKLVLVTVFISALLTGCLSEVDTVKSGVMNFNKTITVGEAFDNWNNCQKGVKEYMSKAKSFLFEKEQTKASYLDIESNTQIFQFTINKDDTFQIDNVQVEIVWSDGKKFSDSQKLMKELEGVYENEITFNASELNKMTASQIAYIYQIIKTQAK